ncbi:MAG: MBL fold metallo-hydrolase [Eubacteriales bacterium]|nr:MBL fold metallo-hydrolase [Eubacteriales bacterium]MDD4390539.1 MBL fold metallo-hydrolase [Eubacteriales bacterium]
MKIKFCGAAESVTGSCHLITTQKYKFLLDCGQFQGNKKTEAMNAEPFPFDPAEIDFVILSHAHVDHCGRLPLLVKRGFKGDVYCTDATADLVDIMLKDSGYIHEKEAEWQNRKNQRAGRPLIEPLYKVNDSVDTLKHIKPVLYDQLVAVNDEIKIVFNDAGHILGSAIVEIFVNQNDNISKIVYSGDLGVQNRPILRNPVTIKKADYLIMETTYGNRLHEKSSTSVRDLINIILKTTQRGGNVVIPSFAVGRTQELIYELNMVYEANDEIAKKLQNIPVIVDSPMASAATEVFKKNAQVYDEETKEFLLKGDHPLDFQNLQFTKTSEESMSINMDPRPKIIISASGMCEAGRIRHHLKHNLWNSKSSIVFVGYQAEGSLGRYIVEGAKEVKLFGEEIAVNAEIHNLEGFSGHADRDGLLDWLSGFKKPPMQVFLVHGELQSKLDFAETIKKQLGYEATVIENISEYALEEGELLSIDEARAERIDETMLQGIKDKISDINVNLQTLLYNTHLVFGDNLPYEKIMEINNILLEIEKSSLNLGSIVTSEDRQDQ